MQTTTAKTINTNNPQKIKALFSKPSEQEESSNTQTGLKLDNAGTLFSGDEQQVKNKIAEKAPSKQNISNAQSLIEKKGQRIKKPNNDLNTGKPSRLDLSGIFRCVKDQKQLPKLNIQQLRLNFITLVRLPNVPNNIQSILRQRTFQNINPDAQSLNIKTLNFLELNELEMKEQALISQLFVEIVQQISKNYSFLSFQGALELLKLYIRRSSNLYVIGGKLNIEPFSQPALFPIINAKITINHHHELFLKIVDDLSETLQQIFISYAQIFEKMAANSQRDKHIFRIVFDKIMDKKIIDQIIKNLTNSLTFFLRLVDQNDMLKERNLRLFNCILTSVQSFYKIDKKSFTEDICYQILLNFEDYYIFINEISAQKKQSLAKHVNKLIEQFVLIFLLKEPFNPKIYDSKLKQLVFRSNLKMLDSFKFLLPSSRQLIGDRQLQYIPFNLHWKNYIQILISLDKKQNNYLKFLFNSIKSILQQNTLLFWQDPTEFDMFSNFIIRFKHRSSSESRSSCLQILQLANVLMGKPCKKQAYPLNHSLPFAFQVQKLFSIHFLSISQDQLMNIIGGWILNKLQNGQDQGHSQRISIEQIIKQYLLKLIITEPTIIYKILGIFPHQLHCKLVSYLLFDTIAQKEPNIQLVDLAFTALDKLLGSQNTFQIIQQQLLLKSQNTHLEDTTSKLPAHLVQMVINIFQVQWSKMQYLARHAQFLVQIGLSQTKWCRLIFKGFMQLSIQQQKSRGIFKQGVCYAKMLLSIFQKLNSSNHSLEQVKNLNELKHLINFNFIIQVVKNCLRFDKEQNVHINILLSQKSIIKYQALLTGINLLNKILNYYLAKRHQNWPGSRSNQFNNVNRKDNIFPSIITAEFVGTQNQKLLMQVQSINDQTTSFVCALSFVLLNCKKQQHQLMMQLEPRYKQIITQCIQSQVKLYYLSGLDYKRLFQVVNISKSLINLSSLPTRSQASYQDKFIYFVQKQMSLAGIQVLMLTKLMPQSQNLRNFIDRIRRQIQKKTNVPLKSILILKILSTLARYFNQTVIEISLSKNLSFEKSQIRDHLDYLLEAIGNKLSILLQTKIPQQRTLVAHILDSIYNSFLIVQRINPNVYLKWVKGYHKLILHKFNLRHLHIHIETQTQTQNIDRLLDNSNDLSHQYYKLLQVIFASEQFLSQQEFKQFIQLETLSDHLKNFIDIICFQTVFQKLSVSLIEILLQILLGCLQLCVKLNKKQTQRQILNGVFQALQPRQILKDFMAYRLIESIIMIQLRCRKLAASINFASQYWPLELNYISSENISLNQIKMFLLYLRNNCCLILSCQGSDDSSKRTNFQKEHNLKGMYFSSICNGIQFIISEIKDKQTLQQWLKEGLIKEIFITWKHFTLLNQKQVQTYKIVWLQQLFLSIITKLTTKQFYSKSNAQILQDILCEDNFLLRRLGLAFRKLAIYYNQQQINWLYQFRNDSIQITFDFQITYANKLQLLTLIKIVSFIIANPNWNAQYHQRYIEITKGVVNFRKIFRQLPHSYKKNRPTTLEQKKAMQMIFTKQNNQKSRQNNQQRVNLNENSKKGQQALSCKAFKSKNYFHLMHELVNYQLTSAYSTLLVSILSSQKHLKILCDQQTLNSLSKWNNLNLDLAQSLLGKYGHVISADQTIRNILNDFSYYYTTNLSLSSSMLFTNSLSSSTRLNSSYQQFTSFSRQCLKLILDFTVSKLQILNKQYRKDVKKNNQKFLKILGQLKKYDPDELFHYQIFNGSEYRSCKTQSQFQVKNTQTKSKVSQQYNQRKY